MKFTKNLNDRKYKNFFIVKIFGNLKKIQTKNPW